MSHKMQSGSSQYTWLTYPSQTLSHSFIWPPKIRCFDEGGLFFKSFLLKWLLSSQATQKLTAENADL